MNTRLETFEQILTLWGGPSDLADDLGCKYVTAQVMRHRKSIGMAHWPKLIEVLREKGHKITMDELVAMKLSGDEAERVA